MPDELVALLSRCEPLARRLIAQGYGYIWSEEDMKLLDVYEQAIAATDQNQSDDQLAALIAQAGLSDEHMLWLVCLHELRPHLEARVAQRPPSVDRPYQPFAELLKGLEQSVKTNMAMGVLSSDDAELIHQPTLARTNPLWLIEAERMWGAFNASLSGLDQETEVAAGERTAGEPRRRREKRKDDLPRSGSGALPSQITDLAWIYAQPPEPVPQETLSRAGHWRIYVSREQVDRLWHTIAEAVERGQLGSGARVSTLSGSKRLRNAEHIIAVYTLDREDEGDVKRVRATLRTLSISWPIAYKVHGPRPDHIPQLQGHDPFTLYYE